MELPLPNNDNATIQITKSGWRHITNFKLALFIVPLLLARFYEEGPAEFAQRLLLLVILFITAYAWSWVFAGRTFKKPTIDQLYFALLFAVLLPANVGWGGLVISASFGWIFAHEVFGGRGFLSPVLLGLTFGIFSFSASEYEISSLFFAKFEIALALACLPVALWLFWIDALTRRVLIGAVLGAGVLAATVTVPQAPLWWEHLILGTFFPGIIFIATNAQTAPLKPQAQWVYGAIIGGLIITFRLTNPAEPDGVVFALLLASLLAPLIDRATGWRPGQ